MLFVDRPRLVLHVLLTLTQFATAAFVFAQTAKQGDPATIANPDAFHSPMVVETIFAAGDRSLWTEGKQFSVPQWEDLGKFTCDGVALRGDHDEAFFWNRPTTDATTGFPSASREASWE